MTGRPPTIVDLTWIDALQFSARLPKCEFVVDSSGAAGPSPVEALGVALAGCMSVDVIHILQRGRHAPRSLRSRLTAERAQDDPHRFLRVSLHFTVEGAMAPEAVERAIALSRDKYCSVWHSLRQDIEFEVTFDVAP